jgi:hypothetical protein
MFDTPASTTMSIGTTFGFSAFSRIYVNGFTIEFANDMFFAQSSL